VEDDDAPPPFVTGFDAPCAPVALASKTMRPPSSLKEMGSASVASLTLRLVSRRGARDFEGATPATVIARDGWRSRSIDVCLSRSIWLEASCTLLVAVDRDLPAATCVVSRLEAFVEAARRATKSATATDAAIAATTNARRTFIAKRVAGRGMIGVVAV
jgi:hypothetical protein